MPTQPHPVLSDHYQSEAEKQAFLRRAFDKAAPHYEAIARWGWLGSGQWYRREALKRAGLKPGMKVIDVASGTGPTARAIRDVIGDEPRITCVEPSAGMMAESRKLLGCEHIQAPAEAIPLPDGGFDFLTMGFALRHVDDLECAFREFHRVLRPGGKVLILDTSLPRNRLGRAVMKAYFARILPFFTGLFTRNPDARDLMAYYWETLEQMITPETVIETLEKAGFREVTLRRSLKVFTEYEGLRAS